MMSFTTAVSRCLLASFDFRARAPRAEFWWFQLFVTVVSVALLPLHVLPIVAYDSVIPLIADLVVLALFIPTLAVSARRLHDIGRSGWWQLLALTLIGVLVLLWWWVQPTRPAGARYGPPVEV